TASILVGGGGGLTRENSVRTLPPYTEMAEEPSEQPGVISMFTRYFFPPGELPPPYEDLRSNETRNDDIRRISTLNYVSDVQGDPNDPTNRNITDPEGGNILDDVRGGVTFEELSRSETISPRSTITRQILPEAGGTGTESTSFENDRDQVDETDETAKLNDNNDN
ncbi:12121_t:CDS:1, partial [Racocetra fulgida]